MTLSLCIINRDDDKNLERLIKSSRYFVDQIVVVDTGSIDNSVKLANDAGADIVIDASHLIDSDGYLNSFSEARQMSFDNSDCDWKMWLDTDDKVDSWDDLKLDLETIEHKRNNLEQECFIEMKYDYTFERNTSRCVQSFYRERIINKDDGWFWINPVHEYLENKDKKSSKKSIKSKTKVIHLSGEARGQINDRNLHILLKWKNNGGEIENPWAVNFYLGDEMLYRKKYDEAFEYFDKCPKHNNDGCNSAIYRAGCALNQSGNSNPEKLYDCIEYLKCWISQRPNIANFRWELARALNKINKLQESKEMYKSSFGLELIESENPHEFEDLGRLLKNS